MRVHLCTQYIWPDCAPTGLLAEQLALCLQENNFEVSLIGGSGCYREGNRSKPGLDLRSLPTYQGKRGSMGATIREYLSVYRAFRQYIEKEVAPEDIVICTSAPPQAIHLIEAIQRRRAHGVYWLQDYYPELLRGVWDYPPVLRGLLASHWSRWLKRWNRVVKISGNLGYHGPNIAVIRNWPTLDLGEPSSPDSRTAGYFGNLGYGHSFDHFIRLCEELRGEGYSVTFLGDGPRVDQLPAWIKRMGTVPENILVKMLWQTEVHLIVAHPGITGAVFPSKYWNSRKAGRRIVHSGFSGSMLEELNLVEDLPTLPTPEAWLPLLQNL